MSHWQPGKSIQGGKYVIAKVLGYGGAGVTYAAQERPEKRWLAIKTLNALMQTRSDFSQHQERFIQEAFRLAKCTHQHIIRVDNICQEGTLWCMVMEYISGGNLRQYAIAKGGLGEEEALHYIQQVGSALDYVHSQRFLHRDVKPANIMLRGKTKEAVLIDFGLAREFVQDEVETHTNSRTESFAPIEQYERRAKRGAYTDVYALAATLYYILTLQIPFPAPFRAQGAILIPPKQHKPSISDRLNAAILTGMEVKPEDRPPSIPAWLELLSNSQILVPAPDRRLPPPVSPPVPSSPPPLAYPSPTVRPQTTRSQNQPTVSPPPRSTKRIPALDTKAPTVHPLEAINLVSAAEINYIPLQQYLTQAQFREADQETGRILLRLAEREKAGWLDKPHVELLPCEDLTTINQLWTAGTNYHFGFSTQKKLYLSLGGTLEHNADIWKTFCDRVGWRQNNRMVTYKDLNFTVWAPEGHLPMLGLQIWGFTGWFAALMARLEQCNL
ncbi:MAG: serine/threonine-protein kinase [Merismopediaceae bacterium]|nr:serine/threonine-protein kinase [Merismopediaceae bacterium]